MTIRPIETLYHGHRFRSRLEARWAVFLNSLNIKYEYEPEGFDIDGTWYLPDFWLPTHKYWLEIKPRISDEYAWPQEGRSVYDVPGGQAFIILGTPGYTYGAHGALEFSYEAFPQSDNCYLWCECPDCGFVGLEFEGRSDRLPCKSCLWCTLLSLGRAKEFGWEIVESCPKHQEKPDLKGCPRHSGNLDREHTSCSYRLRRALEKAQQARFE